MAPDSSVASLSHLAASSRSGKLEERHSEYRLLSMGFGWFGAAHLKTYCHVRPRSRRRGIRLNIICGRDETLKSVHCVLTQLMWAADQSRGVMEYRSGYLQRLRSRENIPYYKLDTEVWK
jgi:hypothetical protein